MSDTLISKFATIVDKYGDFKASDIHLTSDRGAYYVKDKQTKPIRDFPLSAKDLLESLIEATPSGQAAIKTKQQTGASFDEGGKYRGRLAARIEHGGLSGTMRIISREIPTCEDLKLTEPVIDLIRRPAGLLPLVGQTGSGKSTTIAALVNLINQTFQTGIYTLESPIEYLYPKGNGLVIQREIGSHVASFAEGIEDAKRSHPRIIVVGEILNAETARSALLAAASGHLVVTTMHAGTTAEAIDSFTSMFSADEQGLIRTQLAQSLLGVVAQNLIPKKGGGMALAQEIAFNTPALAELIRGSGNRSNDTKLIHQLLQSTSGEAEGMVTMEASIARLVKEGELSLNTAYEYARNRAALEEKLGNFPRTAAA